MSCQLRSVLFLICIHPFLSIAQQGNVLFLNDGNDGAISFDTLFPNTTNAQEFTVEGWVYPKGIPSLIFIDDAYDVSIERNFLNTNSSSFGIQFYINPHSQDGPRMAHAMYVFDHLRLYEWNHVAVMFCTNLGMAVAINGHLIESSQIPKDLLFSGFGRFKMGGGSMGGMDEVRISDIRRYCNPERYEDRDCLYAPITFSSFTNDANTVALYHFDEAAGSTIFQDSSGNGHHLMAQGRATTATPLHVLRPVITMPFLTNGSYHFTTSGPTGCVYIVEASFDWANWDAVTNITSSNFAFNVEVPLATNPATFYRLVVPFD
jgi:hypothetical protein